MINTAGQFTKKERKERKKISNLLMHRMKLCTRKIKHCLKITTTKAYKISNPEIF